MKYQPHKNAVSSHKRNLHAAVTCYDKIQMQDFNLFSKIENNFQQICDIKNRYLFMNYCRQEQHSTLFT